MVKRESVVAMADLRAAAGKRSRQAISAWIDAGLLPRPTMMSGRSGRGRRGVWPASVLERVRLICVLIAKGLTLGEVHVALSVQDELKADDLRKQVDAILGRWLAPGSARQDGVVFTRRRGSTQRFRRKLPPKDATIFQEWMAAVHGTLTKEVGLSSAKASCLVMQAAERSIVEQALWLYLLGFEPVLTISRASVRVTSSSTIGFDHSNLLQQMAAQLAEQGEGVDKNRTLGRITIEVGSLSHTCLILSGDESGDKNETPRTLIPAMAVDEFDIRCPVPMRWTATPYLRDGQVQAKLSKPVMVEPLKLSMKPGSGPERTTTPPVVIPKKARPRKRKAVRRG